MLWGGEGGQGEGWLISLAKFAISSYEGYKEWVVMLKMSFLLHSVAVRGLPAGDLVPPIPGAYWGVGTSPFNVCQDL